MRVAGLCFPENAKQKMDHAVSLFRVSTSHILSVIGDNGVYIQDNSRVPDADVYVASLVSGGFPAFTEWAKRIPKEKIIVMGVLPTVNPVLLIPYAGKIVVGSFDNVDDILNAPQQIVHSSTQYTNITRFDACYVPHYNTDNPHGKFGIATSTGCYHTCDFCATRLLSKGIVSKSVDNLKIELGILASQYHTQDAMLLSDNNFLALPDWEDRVSAIMASGITRGVNVYGSADQIIRVGAAKLSNYPFFGIQVGLEDVDAMYEKNSNLDAATSELFEHHLPLFFSACIHPEKLDAAYAQRMLAALCKHKPVKITLQCLVPDAIPTSFCAADYNYFNRFDPFLYVRNRDPYAKAQQVMRQIVLDYYASDTYRNIVVNNFPAEYTGMVNLSID